MLNELIFALKSFGYSPLLAHVERYHFLQDDFKLAIELKRLGVSFQVNHPSFMLPATSRRGNLARLLYKKGMIDVLGSDMHRATVGGAIQPETVSSSKRV
jgi:tyrosine-protein phosphatase YwqE